MTLLLLWCGAAVALQRPLAAWRAVARRASDDGVVGPGRMPVDEGAISAHEFSRSFNAAPLGAPSTEEELTDLQKQVLLRKSTEPRGHSERPGGLEHELQRAHGTKYPQRGAFLCVQCGTPLYWARSKFGSGSGWPAFYDAVDGAVERVAESQQDPLSSELKQHGTELVCSNCGGHLGHVFEGEGFGTPTDERHCVNGVCLRYDAATPGQPDDVARQFHLTLAPIPD